jgi:hypothetical protein
VVWPVGTRWTPDPPTVVLADGEQVPVGASVSGGGGYHAPEYMDVIAGPAVADAVRRCAGNVDEIAVFNPGDPIDVEAD